MARVIFRYKALRGHPSPMATVGVHLQGSWEPVETYVDSGAAYTLLHSQIAVGIGFDYRRGTVSYAQVGDGSFIPVYLHVLDLQVGPVRLPATVGFSDRLGVGFNLLGRAEVFARFDVCFHERQGFISFESDD